MSLPWETPPPPPSPTPAHAALEAEDMRPDVPVVARNPKTGQQVRVNVSQDLREAIRTAINDAVLENRPALAAAARTTVHRRAVAERTLLQGAVLDLAVAAVAVLATIVSPAGALAEGAWIATAVLAAKTVLQAAVSFAAAHQEEPCG